MRLTLHRIADFLLRLLPGKRSDPNSIEARVIRVGKVTGPIVMAAFAEEQRVMVQAAADARRAAKTAWAGSQSLADRANALEMIADRLI